jgi:hypothetical protein
MKKFILKSIYYVDENTVVNLKLIPEDILIQNYLAYNFQLENKLNIEVQIQELILEFTPVMFNKFQELDAVPEFIKNQYEL